MAADIIKRIKAAKVPVKKAAPAVRMGRKRLAEAVDDLRRR